MSKVTPLKWAGPAGGWGALKADVRSPVEGGGRLTRWHGMWCRAVKGAGIGEVGERALPLTRQ